jgi:hypothetical protein
MIDLPLVGRTSCIFTSPSSSDELSSLEEESLLSILPFPFLPAGALAGFFSSGESSESDSDATTVFLGFSSSEESEDSSDESSTTGFAGVFPFDFSVFFSG